MSPGERRLREARRHLMHASEDQKPVEREWQDLKLWKDTREEVQRSMDRNGVPSSLQGTASTRPPDPTPANQRYEPDPPGLPNKPLHLVGQEEPDAYAKPTRAARERENQTRKMDLHGVPRSLQSQIFPERAGEIGAPPRRPPLSARPAPTLASDAFPPEPPQDSQRGGTEGPRLGLKNEKEAFERLQKSWKGSGGAVGREPGNPLPDWFKFLPSLEHSKDYIGPKWSIPLEREKEKP